MKATTRSGRRRQSVRGGTPTRFADIGRYLGLGVLAALMASAGSWPARLSAADTPRVVVSEVHSSGSSNGTYAADWFEVTNVGTSSVDITGWKMDDNSNAAANAVALRGVTVLAPGKSAVFLEGTTDPAGDAALIAAFSSAWFGSAAPPAGVLVGVYGGSGVGMSGSGDAVNLFDSTETRVTGVSFGSAAAGTPVATFDNSARLGSATLPLPAVSTVSAAGFNGAFVSFNGAEVGSPGIRMTASPLTGIDLSTYVRIGRFDLPEPTRTTAPPNNLLAQEASAVTYNWDTDTLFIVGDGGRAVVQVTKTGELIDTMTLALGSSPQGNEFYDPEGLAYIGGGTFVLTQERDRMAVRFTYVPGATLQRADTQSVTLGTFVENIGLEGLSYDPQTDAVTGPGFIMVKEISPEGLFQTNIDFAAGTATNGSPGTINSVDLFDPALANLLDFADVFALSNLRPLRGQPQSGNLLVLSQEEAKIVNVDREGHIASSLTIVSDPGNPLSVADQQHEGLTMDENGVLYVVSENGGGDINHPQLWVYAPSSVPNQPPTDIALTDVVSTLVENTSTATRLRVAGITVTDDGLGNNVLSVAGTDADSFEADNSGLYIKAGTVLDFETKSSYSIDVQVDDTSVGSSPDATVPYTLTLTDVVNEQPPVLTSVVITEVAPWASGNSPYMADWFEVTNKGSGPVDVTGWKMDDDSNSFGSGVALNGITTIAPGESVIFIETGTPDATKALFLSSWFGPNPPASLQVGTYTGGGVGLSTGGDNVNLFDASGNRVTAVTLSAAVTGFSFDNAAGLGSTALPFPVLTTTSVAGVNGAFLAADGVETGSPGSTSGGGVVVPRVIISEVTPWSSTAANSAYAADWFEITNISPSPVDLTGWKMDDDSASNASAVALNGVTTLAPGQSAVFIETSTPATTIPIFLNAWFGANPPANLLIGSYSGSGVGLGGGGDQVNLFDAAGTLHTGVRFAGSTPGFTFDNAAGIGGVTSPPPVISTLSAAGVNGAFLAADGIETGSPGAIANPVVLPPLVITEVVPWSSGSGNSPYGADWFEVTNTGGTPVDITGFKMDDESGSFGSAVALNGITTIAAGESVIFVESSTPTTTIPAFLTAWFGANAPAGLQIGTYSGSGVGLGNGGDAVNLFDAAGHLVTGVRVGASTTGFTFDNAAGVGATAPPLPTITTLSVAGINGAFLAADGIETGSPGAIVTPDVTPPVIAPVADVVVDTTDATGAVVTFAAPSTLDDVDGPGVATCAPASGTLFPLGTTTVTCTATDAAGNQASSAFTVTVTLVPPPATPDGRMFGIGHIDERGTHHHFAFRVSEIGTRDFGRFEYWLSERRSCERDDDDYDGHRNRSGDHDREYGRPHHKAKGRFDATSIASIVFSDDPSFRPGRGWPFFGVPPRVDSVTFIGTGKWNGKPGYTFKVTATDRGEPGRRHDTFTLLIQDQTGRVVASVDGELDRGNIQSTRLLGFGKLGLFF